MNQRCQPPLHQFIEKVPIFYGMGHLCVEALVLALTSFLTLPSEAVITQGELTKFSVGNFPVPPSSISYLFWHCFLPFLSPFIFFFVSFLPHGIFSSKRVCVLSSDHTSSPCPSSGSLASSFLIALAPTLLLSIFIFNRPRGEGDVLH